MLQLFLYCMSAYAIEEPIFQAPPAIEARQVDGDVFLDARAAGGIQASYGWCPCVRWSVSVQALSGRIETREFVISTDAILKAQVQETFGHPPRMASASFTVGAVEALVRGTPFGAGLDGITYGEDRDRGYSEWLRGGFYAFVRLFQSEAARLDLRGGYDFERLRVNLAPADTRSRVPVELVWDWTSGRWSGGLAGLAGVEPGTDGPFLKLGANGRLHADITTELFGLARDVALGLGVNAWYEHDPYREQFGFEPSIGAAGLYMDFRYEPSGRRQRSAGK